MQAYQTEQWKPIDGYPDYFISDLGRVLSKKKCCHIEPIVLTPVKDKDGHMKVTLCNKIGKRNYFVHRLVATAFIPNPDDLPVVNHIDENPGNNRADNLVWCTSKENTLWNNMPKRRAKPLCVSVVQKSLDGSVIRLWNSFSDIEQETGYSHSNLVNAAAGKRKTAYGYVWEYAEK